MIGQTISHFKVTGLLGEGGMGAVYRAEDTKLGREVAIKVLPEAFTEDAERLARFEREAQILATLNHPNIAAIYEVGQVEGTHFLVMELAEGDTLQERLGRGAIPTEQALDIGRQIATALEAAHEKSVIHRDLKPANIKLTPDGGVKVLDFGLAKAWGPSGNDVEVTQSPTLTAQMTQAGVILGTAAYMSPEQARGEELDKRTDIWSFGCVLYEMLTGRQSFSGRTITDILASVVRETPDLSLLPAEVPRRVGRLLERCLQKNAQDRLRDIGDARIELAPQQQPAREETAPVVAPTASGRFSGREAASWVLSLLLLVALGWAMFGGNNVATETAAPSGAVTRFRISQPGANLDVGGFNQSLIAISPDGRQVIYPALLDGRPHLVLRSLDSLEARTIPESLGATDPFFSADGTALAFFSPRAGALMTAPLKGLLPTELATAGQNRGGSWADDGSIVYSPHFSSGLQRVWPSTGESSQLTEPDLESLEKSHRWPQVLPGSRAAIFTVLNSQIQTIDDAHIDSVDLETGARTTILRNASYARFSPPDRLLFSRGSHLLSVGFDPETLEASGQPEVLVQNVVTLPLSGAALYDISASGSLVYVSGEALVNKKRIHRYAPDLTSVVASERAEPFQTIRLSPDENSLAVGIDAVNQAIWKLDLARDTMIRITHEWGHNDPEWTPDQEELIVVSGRRGQRSLFGVASDGSGASRPLGTNEGRNALGSLTPDGKTIVYSAVDEKGNSDLWSLQVDGGSPQPLWQTPFWEERPDVSSDGRWVAYMSDESGATEVYVQAIDGSGGKVRVSTDGGRIPEWSKVGGDLLYVQPGPPDQLVVVTVIGPNGLEIGKARPLLDLTGTFLTPRTFDTTRDGGFYILIDESPDYSSQPITVVQNWISELEPQ